ncbi:MAG: carboxypeptidase-like regulatory domain-containing protein [Bacteroidota bacterium]
MITKTGCAQDSRVHLQFEAVSLLGFLRNDQGEPMREAMITVYVDNRDSVYFFATEAGEFQVALNSHHKYRVKFSAPGFITKNILVNATAIPKGSPGFAYDTLITLPRACAGVDNSVYQRPLTVISYVDGRFTGNPDYDPVLNNELAAWKRDYTQCRKQNRKQFVKNGWMREEESEELRTKN